MKNKMLIKKTVTLSMFCAIAYVSMFLTRALPPIIPSLPFLQYDPKDVIIVLGGFIFGPLSSLLVSVVVSLIEAITVSDTGPIGLLMNVISTCAFACTAAFVYKKKRTLSGAVVGLVAGCIVMTGVMLLWNYAITPMYMNVPREMIKGMLLPGFMPFNTAFTLLLYKPLISALRAAKLVSAAEKAPDKKKRVLPSIMITVVSLVMIAVLVAVIVWIK